MCEECDAIEHVFRRRCLTDELTDSLSHDEFLLNLKHPQPDIFSRLNEAVVDFENVNIKFRRLGALTIDKNLLDRITILAPMKIQ